MCAQLLRRALREVFAPSTAIPRRQRLVTCRPAEVRKKYSSGFGTGCNYLQGVFSKTPFWQDGVITLITHYGTPPSALKDPLALHLPRSFHPTPPPNCDAMDPLIQQAALSPFLLAVGDGNCCRSWELLAGEFRELKSRSLNVAKVGYAHVLHSTSQRGKSTRRNLHPARSSRI